MNLIRGCSFALQRKAFCTLKVLVTLDVVVLADLVPIGSCRDSGTGRVHITPSDRGYQSLNHRNSFFLLSITSKNISIVTLNLNNPFTQETIFFSLVIIPLSPSSVRAMFHPNSSFGDLLPQTSLPASPLQAQTGRCRTPNVESR